MNIIESEIPYLVEARTCGCKERGRSVSYHFIESSHSLCLEKGELMLAQIQACERLLKYAKDEAEINVLKEEITKLRLALDFVRY
jgi:cell shape-determining protein MreC